MKDSHKALPESSRGLFEDAVKKSGTWLKKAPYPVDLPMVIDEMGFQKDFLRLWKW